MENASKALIMAAGVLIGVLILSLAAYLFISFGQKSRDMRDIIEKNQIMEFNTRFTKFEGTPTATIYDVISLAQFAAEYNISNPNSDPNNDKINVFLGNTRNLSRDFKNANNNAARENIIKDLITASGNLATQETDPETGNSAIRLVRYRCDIEETDYDSTGRLTRVRFTRVT